MKYFWIILGLFALVVLTIWTLAVNSYQFVRNLFHKTKVAYWHPVDWMAQDEYDIYE